MVPLTFILASASSFLPIQEFSGSSPFQICDQETRSKLMEKFFSAAGFPGSGGMEREQEHARGRDEGMERSRSAQPGCLHTRSEKGTAGRQ